jgi:hypothetical protein
MIHGFVAAGGPYEAAAAGAAHRLDSTFPATVIYNQALRILVS